MALFAGALCACPQDIVPQALRDAEPGVDRVDIADFGVSADVPRIDGGRDLGGLDAAAPLDASAEDGGGAADLGNTGPFRFREVALPDNLRAITSLHVVPSTQDLFIGTSNGRLWRRRAGVVTEVFAEPENQTITALGSAGRQLFVAGRRQLHVLDASGDRVELGGIRVGDEISDIVVRGETEVWLVGRQLNDRILARFDGDSVQVVFRPNQTAGLLAVESFGNRLHIGGYGGLFDFVGGSFGRADLEWSAAIPSGQRPPFEFRGFVRFEGELWAFGSRKWVVALQGGTWRGLRMPNDSGVFIAGAVLGDEVFLGGRGGTTGPLWRAVKGRFEPVGAVRNVELYAAGTGADAVYFGGTGLGGSGSVLLEGAR